MNSDIRLQMSFYSNTKIKKLKRCLGAEAVLSLIYLWLYTAENRPHGELRGMDQDDIIVAAQWDGDTNIFMDAMLELNFIDKKNTLFIIHDWKKNNPYAAHAPERKKRAQTAARAKWLKNKEKKVCYGQEQALLPAELSNAPSPSPSPSPSPLPNPNPLPTTATEVELKDREPVGEQKAAAVKKMTVSECRTLYMTYFGTINENQPIVQVLQDICHEYPPEAIREAFEAVPGAGADTLNWVRSRLKNRKDSAPPEPLPEDSEFLKEHRRLYGS